MGTSQQKFDLIWPIAELLRHDYKRSDYGKVILPLTVLRRLDCDLAPTKKAVLDAVPEAMKKGEKAAEYILNSKAQRSFHNRSPYDFARLLNEPNQIGANLQNYINGFSANIREIMEYFSFADQIVRLDKAGLLYKIIAKFNEVDLHPERVKNHAMGRIYEELIRRFSELSNETAGEHFTPREVIKLMVYLLFLEDRDLLRKRGIVRTLYDPACGTGGMLSTAEEHLRDLNDDGRLELFGQEINPESYAICKADMVIKGNNASNIKFGNSFTQDGLKDERFDYMLSNPPFGVEWKKVGDSIRDEHRMGQLGRFAAGLPRVSDGSLLFLQHMLSKRKEDGTRIAVVFNGSPLFSGGAGSGESEIRRWVIENDWLEAVIGLPDQLFYNTVISTYIWIVTNRKSKARSGKIQLINASSENFYEKMKKSLGNKRKKIGDGEDGSSDQIGPITNIYGEFEEGEFCKIFDNADFGYRRIAVERPLRMSFQVTPERVARVTSLKMKDDLLQQVKRVMDRASESDIFKGQEFNDQDQFLELVSKFWREGEASPPPPKHLRAVVAALGERSDAASVCKDEEGNKIADPELRDFENVPLKESIYDYFEREVKPHVLDAWINEKVRDEKDDEVGKIGYEIPFTEYFYTYKKPPDLDELEEEIIKLEERIQGMLRGVLS